MCIEEQTIQQAFKEIPAMHNNRTIHAGSYIPPHCMNKSQQIISRGWYPHVWP